MELWLSIKICMDSAIRAFNGHDAMHYHKNSHKKIPYLHTSPLLLSPHPQLLVGCVYCWYTFSALVLRIDISVY